MRAGDEVHVDLEAAEQPPNTVAAAQLLAELGVEVSGMHDSEGRVVGGRLRIVEVLAVEPVRDGVNLPWVDLGKPREELPRRLRGVHDHGVRAGEHVSHPSQLTRPVQSGRVDELSRRVPRGHAGHLTQGRAESRAMRAAATPPDLNGDIEA